MKCRRREVVRIPVCRCFIALFTPPPGYREFDGRTVVCVCFRGNEGRVRGGDTRHLCGQAKAEGVQGTWGYLTRNVNVTPIVLVLKFPDPPRKWPPI